MINDPDYQGEFRNYADYKRHKYEMKEGDTTVPTKYITFTCSCGRTHKFSV